MARCGCTGASCSCVVTGSGGVTVTGAGSVANPYVISSDVNLQVVDTGTIDLILTGDGSGANPYSLTAVSKVELGELLDVDTTGVATGQVLARQSDGTYRFQAPVTAAPGAITIGNGLQGDGSSGNPLGIKVPAGSGLILDATGLRMEGGGAWVTYTPTLTATTTAPTIGNGSIVGKYVEQGNTITFSVVITIGSTTKRGVGAWRVSLPVNQVARRHVVNAHLAAYGIADYVGIGLCDSNYVNRIMIATSTAGQSVSHSVPASLPAGSVLSITGTYERA